MVAVMVSFPSCRRMAEKRLVGDGPQAAISTWTDKEAAASHAQKSATLDTSQNVATMPIM